MRRAVCSFKWCNWVSVPGFPSMGFYQGCRKRPVPNAAGVCGDTACAQARAQHVSAHGTLTRAEGLAFDSEGVLRGAKVRVAVRAATGDNPPTNITVVRRDERACGREAVCKTDKGKLGKAKQKPLYDRTAGVCVFMKPCGMVVGMHELYGTER